MQGLLDTHTAIWWFLGDPTLSATARQFIANASNEIFVSAASGWEISIKYRLGKLPQAASLANQFPQMIAGEGFIPLPITIIHAMNAGALPGPHKDPFDRLLAAQALVESMPILSIDPQLDQFGLTRIW